MFFTPTLSGDTLKENVGIMKKVLDKDYTLDDYYAITKPELVKLIPGFTEISNEPIKINDLDAQKLIYIGTQGTTKLKWEQVYLIKDKAVYIVSYTATTDTFADYAQKIDEMIATLEIK
ncbi:MAG: DcrB-related protein [bacterium]